MTESMGKWETDGGRERELFYTGHALKFRSDMRLHQKSLKRRKSQQLQKAESVDEV